MKLSIFNLYVTTEDGMIIFNTFTGGILQLNAIFAEKIYSLKNDGINELDIELTNNLVKGGMLLPEDCNEHKKVEILHNSIVYNASALSLTIAPTLLCNFQCPYCYEEGHRYNTMSDEVILQTIDFINKNMIGKNALGITWYGGEPLLRMDIIEKITYGIKDKEKKGYMASIITNGYYYTRNVAQKLKELGVRRVQITIDGPPEVHNFRRKLPSGEDTFFVIMNNVKESADILPINIRINVDKENISKVDEVLEYIDKMGVKEKVGVYLAAVDSINDNDYSHCLEPIDFSYEELRFNKENYLKGFMCFKIPHANLGCCGAVHTSSFVIDPLGDLYKCWDEIGLKKKKSGDIFHPISLDNQNLQKWLGYNPMYYEACVKCDIYPICMGGCPYQNLETNKMRCLSLRYNVEKMVLALRDIKNIQVNRNVHNN